MDNLKPLIQKRRASAPQAPTKPLPLSSHPISAHETLQLNQAIGNRATTRHLGNSGVRVQPKLALGHIDDKYEQEADRVANGQRPSSLQHAAQASGVPVSDGFARQLGHTQGGGSLPEQTRLQMEARLGADLSGVRVHTDSRAGQLNKQLQSHAFTHGRDIYFNRGRYQPGTTAGDQLLAHELTHVAQQQDGMASMLQTGGRKSEEIVKEITELCEKYEKPKLAPNLIEVVNFCLATLKDNSEIEDEIFSYLPTVIQKSLAEEDSKGTILGELAWNSYDLIGLELPIEEEEKKETKNAFKEEEPALALDTILPLESRPLIKLYMEQGVAAPLGQVVLFSGQFSTCSPVIMLNSTTGMGGLFHFGAGSLGDQADSLLELCDQVKPDVIYLMQGLTPFSGHDDQSKLSKFFKENRPKVNIKLGNSVSGLYITLDDKAQPRLFNQSPLGKSVTHDLRKAHKVTLPVNTQFVGKSEVADHWM